MPITINAIERKFIFKNNDTEIELDNIPTLSPENVVNVYAGTYPEITNGNLEYKGIIDNYEIYEITTVIGTKG